MKTAICIRPLLPVRLESSERSEMVTQLLFGEVMDVLEEKESWSRIRNRADGYKGWVTTKMLLMPDSEQLDFFASCSCVLLKKPFTEFRSDDGETLVLPAGSTVLMKENLALFPGNNGSLRFFQPLSELCESADSPTDPQRFAAIARSFLNAPYLWGGKTILGMDCSGLIQLSAALAGIQLPRDASQQAELGESVTWSEVQIGDLAFFCNESAKVTHVGILLGNGKILHASGYVHVDKIDEKGIFSTELDQYTHSLCSIKRLI